MRSFVSSFPPFFRHSLFRSFVQSFVYTFHSFIHECMHSLTRSSIHSFVSLLDSSFLCSPIYYSVQQFFLSLVCFQILPYDPSLFKSGSTTPSKSFVFFIFYFLSFIFCLVCLFVFKLIFVCRLFLCSFVKFRLEKSLEYPG